MFDGPDGRYRDVIDAIYQAGISPNYWSEVLDGITDYYDGDAAVTFHVTQTSAGGKPEATFLYKNYEDKAIDLYSKRYMYMSPWTKANIEARPGEAYCAHDVCPPSTFIDTEFFYDWIRPFNVPKVGASIKLFEDEQQFGTLCMNYDEGMAKRIDHQIPTFLQNLLPHINMAIRSNRYLKESGLKGAYHHSLVDQMKKPAFLITASRRIIYANTGAEQVLKLSRGVYESSRGTLHFNDLKEDQEFSALVKEAAELSFTDPNHGGAMTFSASETSYNNIAEVTPLTCGAQSGIFYNHLQEKHILVVLQYRDNRQIVNKAYLQNLFGFTKKEAEVVAALVEGKKTSVHAELSQCSKHTVRSHLKSAMAKSDCNSQTKLVQLITNMQNAWIYGA